MKRQMNLEKELSVIRTKLYYWEKEETENKRRSSEIEQERKRRDEVRKRVRIEEEERMREELREKRQRH